MILVEGIVPLHEVNMVSHTEVHAEMVMGSPNVMKEAVSGEHIKHIAAEMAAKHGELPSCSFNESNLD